MATTEAKRRNLLRKVKSSKMKADKTYKPKPTIYPLDRPAEVAITKQRRRKSSRAEQSIDK